ncbi:MAG: dihydrofolate reductase [Betaproteobacteria bacterium]|nr:dihydrofolate reductase [Betaproteobacteria bacterium]
MPPTSSAPVAPRIAMIVAMAANRCIGLDNRMPWHLPADLKHFKQTTLGRPVIMGRKTFESILATLGKPLPGRTSIVVTRNLNYQPPGLDTATPGSLLLADSPTGALKAMHDAGLAADEVFVIGGAEVYRAMLPAAARLVVTQIRQAFDGDAFFPAIDPKVWAETSRAPQRRSGNPEVDFDFVEYTRIHHQETPA